MRYDRGHRSDDVIDRRGQRSARGGGGGGVPIGLIGALLRSRFGWVGVVIAVILYVLADRWGGQGQFAAQPDAPVAEGKQDELTALVSFTLDDLQQFWQTRSPLQVPGAPRTTEYRRAKLVLFTDATSTACGFGEAASGPFYCPADERVYIDLGFYRQLRERLGAPGDFAQAYVIAHEVGHHVQNLVGLSDEVHRAAPSQQRGAGGLSVRLELQADCFAGVWAHQANQRGILEVGDVEEAMQAAASIGDDRLQKMARGTVQPESFSHGSSAQRVKWFRRGFESGDPGACDTFGAASP